MLGNNDPTSYAGSLSRRIKVQAGPWQKNTRPYLKNNQKIIKSKRAGGVVQVVSLQTLVLFKNKDTPPCPPWYEWQCLLLDC
jgi:hypothetical protein